MKFLSSSGGEHILYGDLTTARRKRGIPHGIARGGLWAADNDSFSGKFQPSVFFPWLASMLPYREKCLFVVAPDVVGNAVATLKLFREWRPAFGDWPVAFVAQDGQENLPLPDGDWACLFVGGSTAWKESPAAMGVIRHAQVLGKHIHIGRVNWARRYRLFQVLDGSENFTCDGTRQRFDGVEKTHNAWNQYQQQRPLVTI